jgi:hypothetical protein
MGSTRARALRADPPALLRECAIALLACESFDAAVGELASALILGGEPIDYDRLEEAIHPVILAEGWRAGDWMPTVHAVGAAIGHLLAGAEPLGIVAGPRMTELHLTSVGRIALHTGLRARALAPRTSI